ncbi:protein of unknown function [Streptomyces sp. KY70]|nr:protein of unknown function [Streptomyces sp. KY70]
MSAPTPAPGDDSPREGYYPDPSIPGYVRYWNGASWVPGTSRPAPQQAQAAPVEETGPIFFDEEENGLSDGTNGSADAERYEGGPEGEAGSVWQADSARQAGFGGERDRRISWGGPAPEPATAPADPRTPLAQDPTRGALPGMRDGGGAAAEEGGRDRRRRARSRSARWARRPVPHSRTPYGERPAPRPRTAEHRYAAGSAGTPGSLCPRRRPAPSRA